MMDERTKERMAFQNRSAVLKLTAYGTVFPDGFYPIPISSIPMESRGWSGVWQWQGSVSPRSTP